MEIKGKLIQKLPVLNGEGKNGPWAKASFVIETEEQFPRKVCFMAWNDKITQIDNVHENETIKVFFDVESREFNGKWYTDLKMWKLEKEGAGNGNGSMQPGASQDNTSDDAGPLPFGEPQVNEEVSDDLPF